MRMDGEQALMPYKIEFEIFEGICAWMRRGDGEKSYRVGEKFCYPEDIGRICPWLLGSMNAIIQVLRFGGTLGWRYKGTPYEKVINEKGVTTEYVHCIDPASGIVMKITRTKI